MIVRRPVAPVTRPLVSVVIPQYNYGHYLPISLGSVLSQEGVDLEVIVVDDKSTDDSLEVARRLAADDPRVTVVAHETNLRHIATFNDGLSRATGDYVVLISADDALAPGSLARATGLMEADPSVGMVYGRFEKFVDELPVAPLRRSWWSVWDGDEWIDLLVRRGRNITASPEVVMRRSTYEQIGGYDPNMPHTSDMLVWLRAAARGRIGRVNGPTQAYYRVHGGNMHLTEFGGPLDDLRESRETFDRFFALDAGLVPDRQRRARAARASVAREAVLAAAIAPATPEGTERRALLLDFAVETAPEIRRSPEWRWSRLTGPGAPVWGPPVVRGVESLRWVARSQRQMRIGT